MRQIMTRAWAIRREAAASLSCRVGDIVMAECLRMAWAEKRGAQMDFIEIYRDGEYVVEVERGYLSAKFPKYRTGNGERRSKLFDLDIVRPMPAGIREFLRDSLNVDPRDYFFAGCGTVRNAARHAYDAALGERKQAQESSLRANEARLEKACPGLRELAALRDAWNNYRIIWCGEGEDEFSIGRYAGPKPARPFSEAAAQHPRAALYLTAEDYSHSLHEMKAAVGRFAKEMLLDGESCADVSDALHLNSNSAPW